MLMINQSIGIGTCVQLYSSQISVFNNVEDQGNRQGLVVAHTDNGSSNKYTEIDRLTSQQHGLRSSIYLQSDCSHE